MPDEEHEARPEDFGQNFLDVWSDLPGSSWLEEQGGETLETAMNYMWIGWFDREATPDERLDARSEFYEFTGLGYVDDEGQLHSDLFPWDDWREAMGYN